MVNHRDNALVTELLIVSACLPQQLAHALQKQKALQNVILLDNPIPEQVAKPNNIILACVICDKMKLISFSFSISGCR